LLIPALLGVNREAVNRHLRVFEKDGLIVLKRQKIEIMDAQALSALASPSQNGHFDGWGFENPAVLKYRAPTFNYLRDETPPLREHHSAGLMAIDAAEYSRLLMNDAAGTLKRIEVGLDLVEKAIERYQGHTVWHTGDRVLAEFPDAQMAMQAALDIQEHVNPSKHAGKNHYDVLFRIGVHYGEVLGGEHRFSGEAVNTVIRLTRLSSAGGIAISAAVRNALDNHEQLELRFLGDHEIKNVSGTVPVYSASAMSLLRVLALRAETLIPRRFRLVAIGAAVVMLLVSIWITGDRMGRQRTPPGVSQFSIAVLPFTISGDSEDYLADGIPARVRTVLSKIPGLRVIGRESSDYFSQNEASVQEISRALKVAWLLRGSHESVGGTIHITAQLMNAVTNELVWEEQFQDSGDSFSGLATYIVEHIAVSMGISDEDGTGLPRLLPLTNNPEAYELFTEAQALIWLGRQRYMIKAVPLLKSAVELDPSFAEAHAVLAMMYRGLNMLDQQEAFNPELRQELARQSLQNALSLKPNSPLVLAKAAEMSMYDNDYEGGLALVEKALRIDPNNTDALQARSWMAYFQKDWITALKTSEKWIRLEPLSVNAMNDRIGHLLLANRNQEVLTVAYRALTYYPASNVPFMHAAIAQAKLALGDRLGAIDSSRKGMPYGSPLDLWTGLEYDWEFFDDFDPIRSAVGLVYIEEYDRVRQLVIDVWGGDGQDSDSMKNLNYLVNRGEIEALAGDFKTSIEFFERASVLMLNEDGSLDWTEFGYNVLDWSRQSYWPLAFLFAYRKSGQHQKADILAQHFENYINDEIAAGATVSDVADYMFLYKEAQYYAIESRREEALGKLRTWVDRGENIFTYIEWDPFLENLRGDPEFEAIVAEVEVKLASIRMQYHARQALLIEGA
jgi:adenylate cyclase